MDDTWSGPWRKNPLTAVGSRQAPLHDPLVGIETPYCKWLGTDAAKNFRAWGFDIRDQEPLRARTNSTDELSVYSNPAASAEAVRWFDKFNHIELAGDEIDGIWRAWELARFVTDVNGVGILEKMPTSIDSVVALDAGGGPIFAYGPQNGALATRKSLLHPTPGVGSLEWRFRLTGINMGPNSDTPTRLAGSTAYLGTDLVEPWSHLSNGSDVVWSGRQQIVVGAVTLVRLFIQLRGPADRFTVQCGARLSGYLQSAGHLGVALFDATRRTG
jgi:hypothetical protein